MCDCLKLNLGSFCHFDDEQLAFEGPWRCIGVIRDRLAARVKLFSSHSCRPKSSSWKTTLARLSSGTIKSGNHADRNGVQRAIASQHISAVKVGSGVILDRDARGRQSVHVCSTSNSDRKFNGLAFDAQGQNRP
jgi:hypothetical protein